MDCYKIHIFEDTDVDYIFNPDVKWGNISGDIHQQGDLMDLLGDAVTSATTISNNYTNTMFAQFQEIYQQSQSEYSGGTTDKLILITNE